MTFMDRFFTIFFPKLGSNAKFGGLFVLFSLVLGVTAWSQTSSGPIRTAEATAAPSERFKRDVNDITVGIITGTVNGTYIQFGSDLSNVLDQPGEMRVLAILGKGSLQNIADILYVKGIDIGITQSDALAYIKRNDLFSGIQDKIRYITKLYNEEIHVLANKDIKSLEDLKGKTVNFGLKGSSASISVSILSEILNLNITPNYDDPVVALEKVKSGELAGMIGVYGKPAEIYANLTRADNVHFLPIPYSNELGKVYFPATLSNADYGGLIETGDKVDTLAVGAVMIVFNWEPTTWRYNKVARFVNKFFTNIEALQKPPRHPKWKDVNLTAAVPGWKRFPAAEQWLDQNAKRTPAASAPTASAGDSAKNAEILNAFKRFLTERPLTPDGKEDEAARREMFRAFEEWQRSQQ